jgi:hypothetical protein
MTKTRLRTTRLAPWGIATCLATAIAASCGGEGQSDYEASESGFGTDVRGEALGEAACTVAVADATLQTFQEYRAVPPYSNPNCVGAAVVDVPNYTGTAPPGVVPGVKVSHVGFQTGWDCNATALYSSLYARPAGQGTWTKVRNVAKGGQVDGPFCTIEIDHTPDLIPGNDYRVATGAVLRRTAAQKDVTVRSWSLSSFSPPSPPPPPPAP